MRHLLVAAAILIGALAIILVIANPLKACASPADIPEMQWVARSSATHTRNSLWYRHCIGKADQLILQIRIIHYTGHL
jgi:hypothetical protein